MNQTTKLGLMLGVISAALAQGSAPKANRINRAIELLQQGQPIYYTGSHSGTSGTFDQGVKDAEPWCSSEVVTHAALFALAGARFDVPEHALVSGFTFSWLESQVSALTRLVPLGQLAAQRVLSAVATRIPSAVELAQGLSDAELGATLPGLALASAWHETQYSRLFRS